MLLFLKKYLKKWSWHQVPSPIHCGSLGGETPFPTGYNALAIKGQVLGGRILNSRGPYAPQASALGGGETRDP